MAEFFDTDAGMHAEIAKSFLEAAKVLEGTRGSNKRLLFRPTLSLAGHGLEMLLKASMYLNGKTPPTKGPKGHALNDMWENPACVPLRASIHYNAHIVAQTDRGNPLLRGVPEDEEVPALIDELVYELGELHGPVGSYPLRYPVEPEKTGPRTPFLVATLWRTSDDFVKRPNEFCASHT